MGDFAKDSGSGLSSAEPQSLQGNDSEFRYENQRALERLREAVRLFPDFPKPGVLFKDFFPLLSSPELMRLWLSLAKKRYVNADFDVIAGLDARGLVVGSLISQALGKPFIPIRKKGKLPGEVLRAKYTKEYGVDEFEMQLGSVANKKVLLVDDLIASGGSLCAAIELVRKDGGDVFEVFTLLDVPQLNGAQSLACKSFNLISFD